MVVRFTTPLVVHSFPFFFFQAPKQIHDVVDWPLLFSSQILIEKKIQTRIYVFCNIVMVWSMKIKIKIKRHEMKVKERPSTKEIPGHVLPPE